jgi:hypothetical protein
MPFNGSGGFVPLSAPIFPAVPNTTIVSSYYNQNLLDVMSGLGNTVTRDGQSPATANLPMGGFKFSNVGAATGAGEVLIWGQTGTPTLTNLALSGTLSVGGLTTLSAGLNVTGTSTIAGALTVTLPNANGINILSGSAAAYSILGIGRTAADALIGVAGGPGSIFSGDASGDLGIRLNAGTLRLGIGVQPYAAVNTIVGFQGVGAIGTIATTGTSLGTLAGFPSVIMFNAAAAANNRRWEQYANATTMTYRVVDDASSLAANWLEVTRSGATVGVVSFPSGTVGIGGVPGFPLDVLSPTAGIRIAPSVTTNSALIRMSNSAGTTFFGRDSSLGSLTGTAYATGLYLSDATPFILSTNSLERLRVLSNGDLGIGTPAPGSKVDILGNYLTIRDASYSGNIGKASNLVTGGPAVSDFAVVTTTGNLMFSASAASAQQMKLDPQGRLSGKSWHNNASGFAGTADQYVGSGTWTATPSAIAGIAGLAAQAGTYCRVGNVVTCTQTFTCTSATGGSYSFQMNLPIASALVGSAFEASGNANTGPHTAGNVMGTISGAGANLINVTGICVAATTSVRVIFQYEVK